MSSLNPYAASYVPLQKNEPSGVTFGTEKGSKNHDGRNLFYSSTSASNNMPGDFQPASNSYGSSSQNAAPLTDDLFTDEDHLDLDIEFLKMSFPDISEQSLRDVYVLNEDDLDAAIDMLNQLEFDDDVDSSGSLPDTLDIGDVSEPVVSADSASSKQKNVAAEASTSSNPSASSKLS
ncbi:hypothetical protein TanjilG_13973 [Lupinus angustifolius]|uniref:CUE domain-containing protein n=1 Tax=Lupinus angustifolius TaxID=3871 RepID=A0A1J7HQJ3_LUPAN|nr:PREDICTED: polyadenylate-binding protein-interacting protein 5-like [Lupinus angustifolius]XP_019437661.1 PREDICTED: polyadenylate-binding protein-interacting protein 5-like [Lupinus angustifolius]OIW15046.1 hypothetical protein TanjilG_13973 [Lupinus angustifolius]